MASSFYAVRLGLRFLYALHGNNEIRAMRGCMPLRQVIAHTGTYIDYTHSAAFYDQVVRLKLASSAWQHLDNGSADKRQAYALRPPSPG